MSISFGSCHEIDVLDRFLAIQDQRQQCAQQVLDFRTRDGVDNASFDVLRAEMWCLARERLVKSRSEHHNELRISKVSGRDLEALNASRARHFVSSGSATHGDVRVVC